MRIKIEKEVLLQGVQAVIGVISSKNTLPILSNILIEVDSENMKLTATDLDIGIVITIPIQAMEEGSITVPAKRLIEIIRELPSGQLEITTKKNNTVVIESGSIIFKIPGIPKEEFPKLPTLTDKEQVLLQQKELKKMLEMTSFAISHDETRHVLNGICFIITKEYIRMVATDGRRLAMITQPNNTNFKTQKTVIIPIKTIQQITHSLKDEGEIKVTFSKNQAMFQINDLCIVSRLIEGEFPNYEQAIPKETDNKMRINREQFISAIKRASLLTTPESQAIKLQLQKNRLTISKTTPEIGETKEEIATQYKGEDFLIGFNPTYLLDVLKSIDGEELAIEFTGSEKPGVVRIEGNYIYIILPMQIN